jgi:hypothetical protein
MRVLIKIVPINDRSECRELIRAGGKAGMAGDAGKVRGRPEKWAAAVFDLPSGVA